MEYDGDKVDDVMLALLWLTAFDEEIGDDVIQTRAWKKMAHRHMDRLHEKGWIEDPRGKNKSVVFTAEGRKRSHDLFEQLFGDRSPGSR
ncbi:hypothetical protein CRI94_05410 [Longibacter salinarum]|uniref:DUF6429 domain-containing protein n=1 Tax=Longibacter salinarum TaxID=1850348 RepID=A0A2A8D0P8_9BACT|nr:DUF6429 family protein [Longibacter salinarum]PEN14464.1 hypothetical protein CRI94_05410 [Longibacter salinarum]